MGAAPSAPGPVPPRGRCPLPPPPPVPKHSLPGALGGCLPPHTWARGAAAPGGVSSQPPPKRGLSAVFGAEQLSPGVQQLSPKKRLKVLCFQSLEMEPSAAFLGLKTSWQGVGVACRVLGLRTSPSAAFRGWELEPEQPFPAPKCQLWGWGGSRWVGGAGLRDPHRRWGSGRVCPRSAGRWHAPGRTQRLR